MSVASRLKEAREAAGLSQGQAAKRLGKHRPTISEIEAGRRKVSTDELVEFSNLYSVPVDWLVNGPTDGASNARMLLAARELGKMSANDLDRLMKMLEMLRNKEGP